MTAKHGMAMLGMLGLIITSSCGVPLIRPRETIAQWHEIEPGHYRYEDYDMAIEFQTMSQQFSWRFKNKSMVDLVLDHKQVALRLEGNPMAFTLWGELVDKQPNLPVITIKPDRFFETTYPVQFKSPLYPFKTWPLVTLEFTALWKGRPAAYQLTFPGRKPEEDKQ